MCRESVEPQGHDSKRNLSPSRAVRMASLPVLFYRRYISPLTPPSCRFTPTCSQYALDALKYWGVLKGSWLTLVRLSKCHPFHTGGYDPVIPPHEKNNPKT